MPHTPSHLRDAIFDVSQPAIRPAGGMTIEEATRGQFERGVDIGTSSLKRGVFGAAQLAGEALGSQRLTEFGAAGAQGAEEEAAALPPQAQPRATQVDWTSFDDVTDFVGGALGLAAPSLAAAAAAGGLAAATGGGAIPVLAAAGLTSAVPEAGSAFLDIQQETGESRPGVAAATGLAAGALDALGVGRVARAAIPDTVLRDLLRAGVDPATLQRLGLRQTGASVPRRALEAAGAEAATEAAQGAVGDIGRTVGGVEGLDPLDIERRIDEAAIGLVAGGTVGGVPSAAALGVERFRDARAQREGQRETQEQAERAARFTEPDFTVSPEGEARPERQARRFDPEPEPVPESEPERQARRFDPTETPEQFAKRFKESKEARTQYADDIVRRGAPEGAVDLTQQSHIQEDGDTGIKYSRGLQGVEQALAEGRLGSLLKPNELKRVRQAAQMARQALETPDAPISDSEVEFIKSAFKAAPIRMIMNQARALEDKIRRGGFDVQHVDQIIDTPGGGITLTEDQATEFADALVERDPVILGNDRYILSQRDEPFVTAEASRAAAELNNITDVKIGDSLQKQVDALNKKSTKQRYEAVPYSELVRDQARQELGQTTPQGEVDFLQAAASRLFEERSRLVEEAAAEREQQGLPPIQQRFSVLDLYDPSNPEAFLDSFAVIKQIGQEPEPQALDLPGDVFKVAKIEGAEGGGFRGDTNAVFKTVPRSGAVNPQASNIEARLNDRNVQLNLMNLINKFRPTATRERQDEGLSLYERTKRDFNTAMSSLLNDPNNKVEIDFDAISPNTIAFRTKDGIEFTYKQLTENQTLQQQLDDMEQRFARVQRAVEQEQENLAQEGISTTLQADARRRLERLGRQEETLLTNIGRLRTQIQIEGQPQPEEGGQFTEAPEREISGIPETQSELQEAVKRGSAEQRGFEQEPERTGELRRGAQDTSTVASAALEIVRRRGLLQGAPIKNFDAWIDFVDQVYDRAGLPPIEGGIATVAYNPQRVAKQLRKAAGEGTDNAAAPASVIRETALNNAEAIEQFEKMSDNFRSKTTLLDMALGRRVTERRPPSVSDIEQAKQAFIDTIEKATQDRMERFILQNSEAFYGYKATKKDLPELLGTQEGSLEEAIDFSVLEMGGVKDLFLDFVEKDAHAATVHKGVVELVSAINKELGVSHPSAALMSTRDGIRQLLDDGAPASEILSGTMGGFFDPQRMRDGRPAIFVNPFKGPITAAQVMTHEYGHLLAIGADTILSEEGILVASKLHSAMRKVNEEYSAYRKKIADDLKVSIRDVIFARNPTAEAELGIHHLGRERQDVPFATLSESFKDYYLSRNEWLADRIAAQLARTEGGDRAIKDYLDSFKNAYTEVIFGEYPDDNSGVSELFELWLPSNRKLRKNLDEFMQGGSAPGVMFSRAERATPSEDTPQYRRLEDLTQRILGVSLEQLAAAWVPDGNMQPRQVMSKLLMMAQADMKMAESVLHHQMMRYALDKMLKPEEIQLLGNVATSEFVTRQILQRIAGNEEARDLLSDPETGAATAIAYAYQFSITDPTFKLGAKPRSLYQKVHQYFGELLAIINESDSATGVFQAFWQGTRVNITRAEDSGGAYRAYEAQVFGPDAANRGGAMLKFEKWYRRVDPINASQTKMHNFQNPVLSKLADQFQRSIGRTGLRETYFEERTEKTGEFMNRVHKITNTLNESQVLELGQLVRNFTAETRRQADPTTRKAAEDIYLLMADMRAYLKEAGVEVGERGPTVTVRGQKVPAYFPWRFDPVRMLTNAGIIREVLLRPEYHKQIMKMVNQRIGEIPGTGKDQVIDSILNSILNAGGAADVVIDDNVDDFAPGMSALMKRELAWLLEDSDPDNPISEDSKAQISELFDTNVYNTLENYVDQAVKRGAFVRRFGRKGDKLTAALLRAKEAGATDEELKYVQHYVQSMLGSYGRITHLKLNTAINWASEKLGRGKIVPENPQELINPKFAKFNQVLMAYQNLRVLDFAVFTSLVDPAGIAARSGSLSNAWSSFRTGVRAWRNHHWKGNPDYIASVGEMLGITEAHMTNEALQQEYGGNWMSGRAKQVNDALFKYSGLTGWTRMTRLMAIASAMQFMKFHSTTSTAESSGYLTDLGLRKGDLTAGSFDANGNLILLNEADRASLRATDRAVLERDNRLRAAMIRYTNEAILRPNAAQRPVWASDPHFALIFHLKQFMWSFTQTILANAVHQAKNGRYAPLMLAGTLYPLGMGAVDALRDWLRYGDRGAPSMRDATFSDYAMRAMERSGMFGYQQLLLDAKDDVKYGGIGIESFLGPTAGQAMDLLEIPGSNHKSLIDFIDRATPLQNTTKVLEHWAM